jgi:hypothetical protein
MKFTAKLISWVFLPLFMPLYALLITMYLPSLEISFYQEKTIFWMNSNLKIAVFCLYFLFSFLAPAISLVLLKKSKIISNFEIDDKNERRVPIIITAIYCAALAWFLVVKAPKGLLPPAVYLMPIGGLVAILITGILTTYSKISLHALGAGMFLGFLVAYFQFQSEFYFSIIIGASLLGGVIMSARVYLEKHSLSQSFSGYSIGAFVMYLVVHYL